MMYKFEANFKIGDCVFTIDCENGSFADDRKGFLVSKRKIKEVKFNRYGVIYITSGCGICNKCVNEKNIFAIDDIEGLNNRLQELLKTLKVE